MINILVICTGNSCRSIFAQAYLELYCNKSKVNIFSGGVQTHGIHPKTLISLEADGIDISTLTSNSVKEYIKVPYKHLISLCDNAKAKCPYFPAKTLREHYHFDDPTLLTGSDEDIQAKFDEVRDSIKLFIQAFVKHYGYDQ